METRDKMEKKAEKKAEKKIEKVLILGAGTMGLQIGLQCAAWGLDRKSVV